MDSQDKTRFEIQGKSSVKYHLKANHVVEAKRWFWTLNNAIRWAKDEAKEEERRRTKDAEVLRQAKMDQIEGRAPDCSIDSQIATVTTCDGKLAPPSAGASSISGTRVSTHASRTTLESATGDEEISAPDSLDQNAPNEVNRVVSHVTSTPDPDAEEDDYGDDGSSRDMAFNDKDALNITAQSAKLQLDLLANVSSSVQAEKSKNPTMSLSDPAVGEALATYEAAVSSLRGLVQNLLKISRDRDAYWQYRLSREGYLRQMWEESMARVAQEHEDLQSKMGESEEKRRRIKKALKEALETPARASWTANKAPPYAQALSEELHADDEDEQETRAFETTEQRALDEKWTARTVGAKVPARISTLYQSDSDEEEEFFDAIDSGEIEAEDLTKPEVKDTEEVLKEESKELRAVKHAEIEPSFKGYEEPVRKRLKMDYDNRPKISLWVSVPVASWKHNLTCLGHSEIHDRQRHDQDDAAGVFQRADLLAPASSGGFGVRGPFGHCRGPIRLAGADGVCCRLCSERVRFYDRPRG